MNFKRNKPRSDEIRLIWKQIEIKNKKGVVVINRIHKRDKVASYKHRILDCKTFVSSNQIHLHTSAIHHFGKSYDNHRKSYSKERERMLRNVV